MDILGVMNIGSSALRAQSIRLNTISSNLANIETTQTPEGGPYRKKSAVFTSANSGFEAHLEQGLPQKAQGVEVQYIRTDNGPGKMVYDPSHPDSDENGYVEKPNINLAEEMTDMMRARGSYEANVTAIKSAQRMAMKALEIGR